MYIIIPIYLFNSGIPILLSFISSQIIPELGTRILVKLLIVAIVFVVYKKATSIFFGKLQLNLKNKWIDYLTFKGMKIGYYKQLSLTVTVLNDFYTSFFKVIDYMGDAGTLLMKISSVALIIFVYFLFSSVTWADYHKRIFGFNVLESEILRNYANHVNIELLDLASFFIYSLLLTSIVLLLLVILFLFILTSLIQCMFPVIKCYGRRIIDTSDVPISFLKNAIEELESFNFSDSFVQKQYKKNQITELISYALNYFIKVDNGKENPDCTNFCYILWSGHLSEAARNDILFRTNGLYKKMDELCININNMNSPDDKDKIVQNLKMYLKVIEDRDLSKIEGIPYKIKKSNLTAFLIKATIFLQKII